MSSESDFKPSDSHSPQASEHDSSDNGPGRASKRASSEALSSPRKRRRRSRSKSVDLLSNSKRNFKGHQYNDAYRILLNSTIKDARDRLDTENTLHLHASQIGASKWSPQEKCEFFAALDKFGRDDLPGIANFIRTKSIPEIREYLLLLQDASLKRKAPVATFSDIPAAAELSPECCERLELASEMISQKQETFEVKAEQDRYGSFWLITAELAEEIDVAWDEDPRSSSSWSPSPVEQEEDAREKGSDATNSDLLESVLSCVLLKPSAFLGLSKNLFMNSPPNPPSGDAHWTELVTPLASGPSMYHTALNDFHTLAISITRRLVQASLIQATSRLRANAWLSHDKAVEYATQRDVQAAIDMLGLQRDRSKQFIGVARRCGVHVFDGRGKRKRELEWNEVEELLSSRGRLKVGANTDMDTDGEGFTTDTEEFPTRSQRTATPLPADSSAHSEEDEIENDRQQAEEEASDDSESEFSPSNSDVNDETQTSAPESPDSSKRASRKPLTEEEYAEMAEAYDQKESLEEEIRICKLLGFPAPVTDIPEIEEVPRRYHPRNEADDWRSWTDYRAEWEEFSSAVPISAFVAKQRILDDGRKQAAVAAAKAERERDDRRRNIGKRREREIPIRSVRQYAALQGKKTAEFQVDDEEDGEDEDGEVAMSGEDGEDDVKDDAEERGEDDEQDDEEEEEDGRDEDDEVVTSVEPGADDGVMDNDGHGSESDDMME